MIKFSVKNPVLVNILMAALLVIGFLSMLELPREMMPKISFNWVFIMISHPGVSAEEVEKLITIPIEDEISDVKDVASIASVSTENGAFISVKFDNMSGEEFDRRLLELKSEVDKVKDIPVESEDIVIDDFDTDDFVPIISISIVGDISETERKRLAEELKDRISLLDDVSSIALAGVREREIWVEVNPDLLKHYGLSMDDMAAAVSVYGLNIPIGTVDMGRRQYLIRTITEFGELERIRNVVIRSSPGGEHLKVSDVARVSDTWEEAATLSRMNGKPAATLNISKKSQGNVIELIEQIRDLGEEFKRELPPGVDLVYTNDNSVYIRDYLHKLQNNALIGIILVVLVLYVFLGFRNAAFTALGIPISFMATFIFMYFTGNTINGSSLFALVLVLGIIVDDAIIVVENCFRYMLAGMSRARAAVKGTLEVVPPVIAATLTTIAAFLPLMLLGGIMGKFLRVVPLVVSLAIAASIVEAFFILPSHIAEWSPQRIRETGRIGWIKPLRRIYGKILRKVLRRRYWFVGGVMLTAIASIMLIPLVGVELYRDEEISELYVHVWMPMGTNLEETDSVIRRIEALGMALPEEELDAVVGSPGILMGEDNWIFSPHVGQVIIDLTQREYRERALNEIIADIREKVKDISGPERIAIAKTPTGPPTGKAVEVKVKGKYLSDLKAIAEELKAFLGEIPGVYDIGDNLEMNKPQLNIAVNPDRAALYHLNAAQVAGYVHAAVKGRKATVFLEGDEEVDVLVKYLPEYIDTFEDIRSIEIPAPGGLYVPFTNIARLDTASGIAEINRYKRDRAVTVFAEIDKSQTTTVTVNSEISRKFTKEIQPRYPEYKLDFSGEFEEFRKAFEGLIKLFGIGILLIYVILGAQFKSFLQPVIILVTIPFALIGAVVGLLINGNPFSIITMYGFAALAGVVVNDAIVMVTFINNHRRSGGSRWHSIIRAGKLRLRPIILTSITTICGVAPMALGLGGKSEVWSPMANIIAWGLAAATFLTLLIVPAVYTIVVDDISRFISRKVGLDKRETAEVEHI